MEEPEPNGYCPVLTPLRYLLTACCAVRECRDHNRRCSSGSYCTRAWPTFSEAKLNGVPESRLYPLRLICQLFDQLIAVERQQAYTVLIRKLLVRFQGDRALSNT